MLGWFRRKKSDYPREVGSSVDISQEQYLGGLIEEADNLEDDPQNASAIYNQVLLADPNNLKAYLGLARLSVKKRNWESALELLQRAVDIEPGSIDACLQLSAVYRELKQFEDALDCLLLAEHHSPDSAVLQVQMGNLYEQTGKVKEALDCYARALTLDPNQGQIHVLRGSALQRLERVEEAIAAYESALDLNPDLPDACNNLGNIYLNLEEYEKASIYLERAVQLLHGATVPLINLGCAYRHLGQFTKAHKQFVQVLQHEPNNFEARYYQSHAWLAERQFDKGWPGYELRFHVSALDRRMLPFPQWGGEDLSGKTLLVYAEQGLGDEIMFASCLPDVISRAGHCVIECNQRLAPLVRRSFPEATVFGSNHEYNPSWLKEAPPIDFQISMGSLPLYFRKYLEDFPAHKGYLCADPERISYWRQRLTSEGTGSKIGISWRGGTAKTRIRSRSIPLDEWGPILSLRNCQFVSLQYGDCAKDLEAFKQQYGVEITHWQEAIDDYDETAALVSSLDLVVTVCTAVVHLTGALGKPVWVMAPAVPEWRYMQEGDSLPWYPSSTIHRQSVAGEWEPVVSSVAKNLSSYLSKQGG